MALSKDNVKINVDIDKDIKVHLDKISKEYGLPNTAILIRNLLLISLRDQKIATDLGITKLVLSVHSLLNKIPFVDIEGGHPLSKSENTVTISLSIHKDVKELLDKYVDDLDIPLKKFTRNLIYTALDDLEFLKRTGLIRIACLFKRQLKDYHEFEKDPQKFKEEISKDPD